MNESEPKLNDIEKYLQSGEQTQITPAVLEMVAEIQGIVLEKVEKIIKRISQLESRKFNLDVFRKRTGSQILEDGYCTGCIDSALAFITLARASGIPAKYIETISEKWLNEGGTSIAGHIYSQIYDEKNDVWRWVDPMGRKLDTNPETDSRVVFKEGLDSWDIGMRDFESMKELFYIFRKGWPEEKGL